MKKSKKTKSKIKSNLKKGYNALKEKVSKCSNFFYVLGALGIVYTSPVIMDEVKDIYLIEYVAKKASPVKFQAATRASSFQLSYRGKRFTVTNKHVCEIVKFSSGSPLDPNFRVINPLGKYMDIGSKLRKIIAIDNAHDLCILEPDLAKPSFKLASFWKPGERVTIIGNPRGLPQTIREGRIVTAYKSVFPWVSRRNELNTFMIDTISYGGNSGSPVINRFGNIVGVLFAGSRKYFTEALVVPVEAIRDFLDRYIDG